MTKVSSSTRKAMKIINEISINRLKQLENAPDIRNAIPTIVGMRSRDEEVFMEIIQNADDAEATEITFILRGNQFYIAHNGIPFSENDVKSICSVGKSTKKAGRNIGFMGIGFKAVFNITRCPSVFSNAFRFSFDDTSYIVPKWVDEPHQDLKKLWKKGTTIFHFPLRDEEKSKGVHKALNRGIDKYCLIMLNNIQTIKVDIDKELRWIRIKKVSRDNSIIELREKCDGKINRIKLLVRSYKSQIPQKKWETSRGEILRKSGVSETQITLAFPLRKDGTFAGNHLFNLYAFFPLMDTSRIPFIIHADFEPTTDRNRIPWEVNWNRWMFREIVKAVIKSIVEFTKSSELKYSIFGVLPAEPTHDLMEEYVLEPIFEKLKLEKIIPTHDGFLSNSEDTILAPRWFVNLFGGKEFSSSLRKYLNGSHRFQFVHPEMKYTEVLQKRLDVQVLADMSPGAFIQTVLRLAGTNKRITKTKDVPWFSLLYSSLGDLYKRFLSKRVVDADEKKEIRDLLENSAIYLTNDGSIVDGSSFFLPATRKQTQMDDVKLPGMRIVHPDVLDRTTKTTLKELGVSELTRKGAFSKIIDSYKDDKWKKWSVTERKDVLKFSTEFLMKNKDADLQERIISGEVPGIPVPVRLNNKRNWMLSSHVYLRNDTLTRMLPKGPFLDVKYISNIGIDSREVAVSLGILEIPRVRRIRFDRPFEYSRSGWSYDWTYPSNFSQNLLSEYYQYSRKHNDFLLRQRPTQFRIKEIHVLEGFNKFIKDASRAELNQLFEIIEGKWEDYYSNFLKDTSRWKHYSWYRADLASYFVFQLRTFKWIPMRGRSKERVRPMDLVAPFLKNKDLLGNTVQYFPREVNPENDFINFLKIILNPTKEQLLTVYEQISREKEVENWGRLGRLLEEISKRNLRKMYKEWVFPNSQKQFKDISELVWIDNPDYDGKLDDKGIVAWCPTISKPQKIALFSFFQIDPITEATEQRDNIEPLSEDITKDEDLTERLRLLAPHVYSVLTHEHQLKSDDIQLITDFFAKVTIHRYSETLLVNLDLMGEKYVIPWDAFVDVEKKEVLLSHNVGHLDSIARACIEAMEDIDFEDDELLCNHLVNRLEWILSFDQRQAHGWMSRHGIELISPNTDDIISSKDYKEDGHIDRYRTITDTENTSSTEEQDTIEVEPDMSEHKYAPEEQKSIQENPPKPLEWTPRKKDSTLTRTRGTVGYRQRPGISPDAIEMGKNAEEIAIQWEKTMCEEGTLEDVTMKRDKGYDFFSIRSDGTRRHIEVKGYYDAGSIPTLTPQEYNTARKLGDEYYLYIVTDDGIYVIQNPISVLGLERIALPQTWWRKGILVSVDK